MPLRILHISDLHERGPHESERFRRDLVLGDEWKKNLDAICEDGPIDLVCFTGDVAYSGKSYEYDAATRFVFELKSFLNVDNNRLFLVPGNHDVDRKHNEAIYEDLRNAVDGQVNRLHLSRWMAGTEESPRQIPPEHREEILKRQGAYRKWLYKDLGLSSLAPSTSTHPHLGYRVCLQIPNLPVVHIVGLNTAWLSGHRDVPGNLLLTDDQLLRLASDENGTPLKGLRIALMHHSFFDLEDGKSIQKLMAGRIDIVLRGHLHCTESSHFVIDADRQFAEFAVSSLYDGGSADQYPNGCQVITLGDRGHEFSRQGINRFRSWSPQNYFWYDDNSLYPNTKDGRLDWSLSSVGSKPLGSTLPKRFAGLPLDYSLADYLRQLRRSVSRESIADGLIRPDRVYISQFALEQSNSSASEVKLLDVMDAFWNGKRKRIVVLGNYGMGKTYFALKTILQQVYAFRNPADKVIPVFFRLRNFSVAEASAKQDEKKDLVSQILREMISLDFPAIDRDQFVQLIREGRVGIVLDGLDELNVPRDMSWQKVLEPLLNIGEGNYVITSRTAFIQNATQELSGWDVLEIQEWGQREWRDYVHHSSKVLADMPDETAFLQLIDDRPQLSKLTTRPLWCHMIVDIRQRIQSHRDITIASLYQEFLNEALEQVMKRNFLASQILTETQKFYALERFAEVCMLEERASLDEQSFLKLLNKIFVLLGLERLKDYLAKEVKVYSFLNCDLRNHYSFGHKSFAEYFLAAGIGRQLMDHALQANGSIPVALSKAYITLRDLTVDQLNFLAGILGTEHVLTGLGILASTSPYADAHVQVVKFIEKELTNRKRAAVLRRNLFLTYLIFLRSSMERPRFTDLDVSGLHLPKIDLHDCDLINVNFSRATLIEADFRNCTLKGCQFQRADVDGADFTLADLEGADFRGINPPVDAPRFNNVRNPHLAHFDEVTKMS